MEPIEYQVQKIIASNNFFNFYGVRIMRCSVSSVQVCQFLTYSVITFLMKCMLLSCLGSNTMSR